MTIKVLGRVAVALGVMALAAPAAAQAAPPVWLSEGKPLPAGVVEKVATKGKLTLTVRAATGAPITTIKCKVKDEEEIQNGPNGGTDEMTSFVLFGCKAKPSPCPTGVAPVLTAKNLPWRTALEETPEKVIVDAIFGANIEVSCQGTTFEDFFEGVLRPTVGASTLIFGPGSGSLHGTSGDSLEIQGVDKLKGPKGDKNITAA
ncbi:MAG TPA: hypothetical protein VNV44_10265 [Solirubrobacteraceae bacterium]|jgi:hypothetical protein|nr:hypothetical protein [Solirubrobacteraceae bacterium]